MTDAGHTDAGLGLAAAEPASPDRASRDRTGPDRADAAAADLAQHGRGDDSTPQDRGYPAPDGQERADDAAAQGAGAAAWAQDSDPGFDYSTDQGLDYGDDEQALTTPGTRTSHHPGDEQPG